MSAAATSQAFTAKASALQAFQAWLVRLLDGGLAAYADALIRLDALVTKRFCLGVSEGRMFLGVQDAEADWFVGLPWRHIAVKRGSKQLSVVSRQTEEAGAVLPVFALVFQTTSAEGANLLVNQLFLDIRRIDVQPDGKVVAARQVLGTLAVLCVEDDSCIRGLQGDELKDSSPAAGRRKAFGASR